MRGGRATIAVARGGGRAARAPRNGTAQTPVKALHLLQAHSPPRNAAIRAKSLLRGKPPAPSRCCGAFRPVEPLRSRTTRAGPHHRPVRDIAPRSRPDGLSRPPRAGGTGPNRSGFAVRAEGAANAPPLNKEKSIPTQLCLGLRPRAGERVRDDLIRFRPAASGRPHRQPAIRLRCDFPSSAGQKAARNPRHCGPHDIGL